jgi:diguanylate cyclase (GGDEF)-like protein
VYPSAMARPLSFAKVLAERIRALKKLTEKAPEYPSNLYGPGHGVPEWEGAYERLGVWLRDTVRKVSEYDVEAGAQLESIPSSHARYDAEEEFRLDSQRYLALLSALAENPENANLFPRKPAGGVTGRPKAQKFGILDAPQQLESDLPEALGLLGAAVIYLDIDYFKEVNKKFTERVVDKTILPQFQRLITEATGSHGHAYAEGGDEVVVLLPNFSLGMATAFATDLLALVRSTAFVVESENVPLTISVGLAVASTPEDVSELPERANLAKSHAKEQGRDRVSLWTPAGCTPVPAALGALDQVAAEKTKTEAPKPSNGALERPLRRRTQRKGPSRT